MLGGKLFADFLPDLSNRGSFLITFPPNSSEIKSAVIVAQAVRNVTY
jgi:hypothetical protein